MRIAASGDFAGCGVHVMSDFCCTTADDSWVLQCWFIQSDHISSTAYIHVISMFIAVVVNTCRRPMAPCPKSASPSSNDDFVPQAASPSCLYGIHHRDSNSNTSNIIHPHLTSIIHNPSPPTWLTRWKSTLSSPTNRSKHPARHLRRLPSAVRTTTPPWSATVKC